MAGIGHHFSPGQGMIRRSMPLGHDPMAGYWFSEEDHAQIMSWSMVRKSGCRFSEAIMLKQ